MNIALIIIGMMLAFMAGFFVALKSLQIGLKWQMDIKKDKAPVLNNPVAEVIKSMQPKEPIKQMKLEPDVMDEWINGAKEER